MAKGRLERTFANLSFSSFYEPLSFSSFYEPLLGE